MAGPGPTTALPGMVYGRLTVIEEAERAGRMRRVLVKCECGTEKIVRVGGLANGTRSCGCLTRERAADLMKARHSAEVNPEPVTREPGLEVGRAATVVEVWRSDGIRMWTVDCPFCPDTHAHCVPDDLLPTAEPVRSSKCGGRTGGLYRLVGVPGVDEQAA